MGGETSQGTAFTWSRKQTLLRLEINALSSVHFTFTVQNRPSPTSSHAVHEISELQRLIPVHKALAKAFWMRLPVCSKYVPVRIIISPKNTQRSVLNFIRHKTEIGSSRNGSESTDFTFFHKIQATGYFTIHLSEAHPSLAAPRPRPGLTKSRLSHLVARLLFCTAVVFLWGNLKLQHHWRFPQLWHQISL